MGDFVLLFIMYKYILKDVPEIPVDQIEKELFNVYT